MLHKYKTYHDICRFRLQFRGKMPLHYVISFTLRRYETDLSNLWTVMRPAGIEGLPGDRDYKVTNRGTRQFISRQFI